MISTLIYYLLLFLFVFFINFNKIDKIKTKTEQKISIWRYFLIAQELVYASAGIFILLMEKDKTLIAPIAITYALLVYLSSTHSELDESKSERKIYIANILIVIVIMLTSIYSFVFYLPSHSEVYEHQNKEHFDTIKTYTVIIPYSDNTLKKIAGGKYIGNRKFFLSFSFNTDNKDSALIKAKEQFYNSPLSKPIYPDVKDVDPKVFILENDIIIKKEINIVKKE